MPVLNDQERRDSDIYHFIRQRLVEKVGNQQKYRFAAILEMANKRFYLSPETLARIFYKEQAKETITDPNQLGFEFGDEPNPPAQ